MYRFFALLATVLLLAGADSCPLQIASPGNYSEVLAGQPVPLRATLDGGSLAGVPVTWTTSRQSGVLATGAQTTAALPPGVQELKVSATLQGRTLSDTTVVKAAPYESPVGYTGGYRNAVVGGKTAAGKEFILVAGKHTQNFPFYDPKSKFDNVLIKVGSEYFHVTAADVPALAILPGDGSLLIQYSGPAKRLSGVGSDSGTVALSFSAPLVLRHYQMDDLVPTWNLVALRWSPQAVTSASAAFSVSVDGAVQTVAKDSVFGHFEEAYVSGIKGLTLGYRYWAGLDLQARRFFLAFTIDPKNPHPAFDAPVSVATNAVALSFVTSFPKKDVSPLKLPVPFSNFTYGPTSNRHGPAIDLGPATLRRTITEFKLSPAFGGQSIWGLEEEFLP